MSYNPNYQTPLSDADADGEVRAVANGERAVVELRIETGYDAVPDAWAVAYRDRATNTVLGTVYHGPDALRDASLRFGELASFI